MAEKKLFIYTVSYQIKGAGRGLYHSVVPAHNAASALRAVRTVTGKAAYGYHIAKKRLAKE